MTQAESKTVVCWGELLWDLFPDQRRLGGASANVAYHVALLGEKAVLVSRVGNDELGALALRALESAGVDVEFVQTDPTAPTGTVHVELVDGEPSYRIATSVAWDRIEWRPELGPVMKRASAVCFGTLAQREPPALSVLEHALSHTSSGTVRLCDLNVRPPFASRQTIDRALGLASALKLNEAELRSLGEIGKKDALDWLFEERGLSFVAVTLGPRGCLLATPDARHGEPAVPLDSSSGDPVGAGDAFTAVLAHGLPRGMKLAELAARANRYAAHVASHAGAMPPPPAWLTT